MNNNFHSLVYIVNMSTVIRRFMSYVGKVRLSDFKNPTHAKIVDQYCKDQEAKVRIRCLPRSRISNLTLA